VYSFIRYSRQLELKSEIVHDAFTRIGHIPLDHRVEVRGSDEHGYRMRARLHVRDGQVGFYREGTHDLCSARSTRQVADASIDAIEAAVASLTAHGLVTNSVELSENLAGDRRALHATLGGRRNTGPATAAAVTQALDRAALTAGLQGITARDQQGDFHFAGDPVVCDPLSVLTNRPLEGELRRHPEAFFQANRFLLAPLVHSVMGRVDSGPVVDLYAGVGLFSVSLAAAGIGRITAVEGDPVSGRDLKRNATPFSSRLRVIRGSVESFLDQGTRVQPRTVIVDPPRTGMSKAASEAITALRAARIVYVSCDAATMARDARRLLDAGYRIVSLQGFDLFPNTPHVETLGVFDR
jgi:23S rRNA (uracil1939-C5)-methyltransferase